MRPIIVPSYRHDTPPQHPDAIVGAIAPDRDPAGIAALASRAETLAAFLRDAGREDLALAADHIVEALGALR